MPRLSRVRDSAPIAEKLDIADNFFLRFKGLLGRSSFEPGEGLMITKCRSVHMFFMRFAIDVLFCDSRNTIVAIKHVLRPWATSGVVWEADYVIELPAGTAAALALKSGDELRITR
jgi:uncharacterized protein